MRCCKWLMMAVMICTIPVSVNAQLERTVWAWDTMTPDRGNMIAGLWYTYGDYDYRGMDARGETQDTEIMVSYGITANWSVEIIAAWSRWEETVFGTRFSDDGMGDTRIATRFRFLEESRSGMDLALRAGLGIPTGDEERYTGTGNWEPSLELLAAKQFGPVLAVANLGIRQIIDSADTEQEYIYTGDLECVLPLADPISASFFLSGWTRRWKSAPDDTYLQMGVGLKATPTSQLFFSGAIYRLVNNDLFNDAWYFSLGMGVEF